jgi:hypothetical protein
VEAFLLQYLSVLLLLRMELVVETVMKEELLEEQLLLDFCSVAHKMHSTAFHPKRDPGQKYSALLEKLV